ncbi:MAG TPA: flagellar basal body rod C-terminal domain-containing protein, partial [Acidobacteriota bacterium]|nr:flagellar basal body rod C-terminal domain-containing protein [Acidobacteriota bacterium]
IELRDRILAGYLDALDAMASGIVSRVNEMHAQGTDLDGNSGGDFFSPFVSIRTMRVDLTDPRRIAAAGAGAGPGNNDNAKLLAGIGEEKLFASSTKTVLQAYAELLYEVGAAARSSEEKTVLQNNLLNQLKNQRSALSGVDLNEQAVHLIKYQKAYQASARYAAILDALSNEILNILGR